MSLAIGNGAGFLGDHPDAPRRLAASAELDYLTLEYLAELTMSILARSREKDPAAGYAQDFIESLTSLAPLLKRQSGLKIVTNAGGVNPQSCARAAARALVAAGLSDVVIGVVSGDDLLSRIEELRTAGCDLAHFDTGEPLGERSAGLVCAHAYLGGEPIARALDNGARIVITGRVADASLTVGPAVHHLGWEWLHLDRLAGATVAGHLIECGAQVTGGYLDPSPPALLADVGYPIALLEPDGRSTITKPRGSGGRVTRQTVAAQLVYEIGDPAHYLTPDVDADFTSVELAESGPDQVHVQGAQGGPPPESYKASLAYRAGYFASGELVVYGEDCLSRATATAELIFARLRRAGIELEQVHVERLGAGESVPGLAAPPPGLKECVLRIAARDARREALARFLREFAPLATSGPSGLAGYTAAAGTIRPSYAYWPSRVPRDLVQPRVDVRKAGEWAGA